MEHTIPLLWLAFVCALAMPIHPTGAAQFKVADYGAVADGTTNCAPAFNQAINARIASGTGNEIFIPAGKYRLSKPVEVRGSTASSFAASRTRISARATMWRSMTGR